MPGKRTRTQQRFDELYALAQVSHQQKWSEPRTAQELSSLIMRNYDLIDPKAIETLKAEFWAMADRKLDGWLPKIRDLAQATMEAEAAGTNKRFNHVMIQYCRRANRHPRGAAYLVKEIEAEIS